jgi:predicted amidophosphoribosyltransferase
MFDPITQMAISIDEDEPSEEDSSQTEEKEVGFIERRLICSKCGAKVRKTWRGMCESCYRQWQAEAYYGHRQMEEISKRFKRGLFG